MRSKNSRFAIILSRFNEHIGSKLLEGAKVMLLRAEIPENQIDIVTVPGAFEIPLAAKKLALTKKYDAIITLGCVIRGGTIHFDQVCQQVASGIQQVALETGVPVTFGIIMANTAEQAMERSGGVFGNRGEEAARAALEMANLVF